MNATRAALVAAVVLFVAAPTAAQSSFGFEVRAGPAFATQDLGNGELDIGFGFEGAITFWPLPHTGVYGGWNWHTFRVSNDSFAGEDVDVDETGYAFGLRFEQPIGHPGSAAIIVRAGGTWNHLEVEDGGGNLIDDSGHGLGWEVGAGFAIPLNDWHLTPSIRFRSLARDLDLGATPISVDLTYFAVEVGVARRF